MRIWASSDLHTDYPDNRTLIASLSDHEFLRDALIVAGDVSDHLDTLAWTLNTLAKKFAKVFFCVGNHELWFRKDTEVGTSIDKLAAIGKVCSAEGVLMQAAMAGEVRVVPLHSWYHPEWDREADIPGATPIDKLMVDFKLCRWPPGLSALNESLARFMDGLNDPSSSPLPGEASATITFSHFVPRQELLPEKRMLFHPNLAKASGSTFIEARIRSLKPIAHVFGHTHFHWDSMIEGVRYVQRSIGYPEERKRRGDAQGVMMPMLLFDPAHGGLTPPQPAYWSDYYARTRRDPNNIQPAPWVTQYWDRSR
jgi:hypothetical protein